MRSPSTLVWLLSSVLAACAVSEAVVREASGGAAAIAEARAPVRVVYFTPADREPLPGYRDRLDRVMTDVQSFYRDEMARNGYGPLTFDLERNGDGRLRVYLVRSEKTYAAGQTVAWDDVGIQVNRALRSKGIGVASAHVVVFQNLVFTTGQKVECWAPYGGLGNHQAGRACVTDHADVEPANLVRAQPVLTVNDRKQPLNEYVMAQMGGVAHELGHALGLPHNMETSEEGATLGRALMGSGNYTYRGERAGKGRGSFLSKASALLLSRHPLFADVRDRDKAPRCTLPVLDCRASEGRMHVQGRVAAEVPVAGLAVYLDPLPARSDYDAGSWTADVGSDGGFRFDVPRQPKGLYELRLRFVHANGAQSIYEFPYRLDDPDEPPVGDIARQHLYKRLALPAYGRRDADGLRAAIAALEPTPDRWLRKARLLAGRRNAERRPPFRLTDLPAETTEAWLSDALWESATVGWASPMRNVMPDSGYLMESGDDVHAEGLYAHAPSRYVFRLSGKWTRFEAGCGLLNWTPGSVSFQVKGDGRLLWECGKITDWTERRVSVGVAGVQELELIADPTDDGKYADTAIWFSPKVVR